jgi:tetratricopeptide (TPR) repeat protein
MFRRLTELLFTTRRQKTATKPFPFFTNKKHHQEEAQALKELGNTALKSKNLPGAESHYRAALAAYPEFDEAHNNLGVVLEQTGRFGEAVECYLKALTINPTYATACLNLSNWHKAHGNIEEQTSYLEKAISLKPDYYEAHNNLGCVLRDQGRIDEAISCFHSVLSIKKDFPLALLNLAVCHRTNGNNAEELAHLYRAVTIQPDYWAAHNQLGYALLVTGELTKAEHHFRTALSLNPEYASAKFNLGVLQLQKGNYKEGLPLYESRFEVYKNDIPDYDADYFTNACRAPAWSGEDLQGKSILLWMDQGLGDNLMMLRFLPQLISKGVSRLVLLGRPPLVRLFDHVPYAVQVIEAEADLHGGIYDYHCALTSLPYHLGTLVETIPCDIPYIFVPEDLKRRWKNRLSTIRGMKVGLVWAGNKKLPRDHLRSIPLAAFQPLEEIRGITFISLQKGDASEELPQAEWLVQDCIAECNDFLDTAALVENLDLVISVDTSTAHLTGALGKPVWLLNRFESEWRWMSGREDSPWYPTMRIFNQPTMHDWTSVIEKLASELAALSSAACIEEYETGTI